MPCPHGKSYPSRCKDCNSHFYCSHGKRKGRCIDCGGTQICPHGRIKYGCKDCKGSAICIHERIKTECRECNGSRFCLHGKRKSRCVDCGGNDLCTHLIKKYYCKICGGNGYCIHGIIKQRCKECGGSAYCQHDKIKAYCRVCGGSAYCQHDKIKAYCRTCGGSAYCSHDKLKNICKLCVGKDICKHNKHKSYCKECDGSACCKSSWCLIIPSNPKYEGYCLSCYVHLFPDKPITRNYKTKESAVGKYITDNFPEQTWIQDKRIFDGCSLRRPDIMCDLGDKVLIIEVDEGQHQKYISICENKRLMELSKDVGHRPLVIIRFNPDSYTDSSGLRIEGCWANNKFGLFSIIKREEWEKRLAILKQIISKWLIEKSEKTIHIEYLYFNTNTEADKIEHV